MVDTEELYLAVGRKIRKARERSGKKLSQDKLAQRLGVSRASIVNIEAGRQHAPLHLLWQIAEVLGTDLAVMLPTRDELTVADGTVTLDVKMLRQIEEIADGNPQIQKQVAIVISKLKSSIENTTMNKNNR